MNHRILLQKKSNMGIKCLNRYLRTNCKETSMRKISLKELSGKTIVIDTSIYLYKFLSYNVLMENMYMLVSVLLSNYIKPIFVFDGKPPPEKKELLIQRYYEKKESEKKYNFLMKFLEQNINLSKEIISEIKGEMEQLRRKFIRISEADIINTKKLLDAFGITYYDSSGEADQLCAYLVKTNKAWGCASDDMDMLLYDCPFTLRNISLLNQTAILYDRKAILEDLQLSERHFLEIMVLSGTDYNNSNMSFEDTINMFNDYNKYKNVCKRLGFKTLEFYVWLVKNKGIDNYLRLLRTYQTFQLLDTDIYDEVIEKNHLKRYASNDLLQEIMNKEGFVFL